MQGDQFIDCNPRTLEMFGCKNRDQIIGQPPYEFSPPLQPSGLSSREMAIEKVTAALAGEPQFFEWMHTRLDGSLFRAEVSLNTITLKGQILLQAIVRDISERAEAEKQILEFNASLEYRVEERTDELRRSNAELEQFAYVASHDLQEPLRMVTSFVQLLQRKYGGKLGDEADQYINHVVDGAERMRRLILGVLELSRVERTGRTIGEVDTNVALDAAIKNLRVIISESGAKIHREELPVVSVDSEQLIQLFQNLLSNAIKYKEEGSPRIDIGAIKKNGMWVFSVEDNGPGIAPEHRERIFQIFQRLKLREDVSGTGIGLAICQRIVNRHGGKIWIEDGIRGGAAFRFSLPGMTMQEN